MPDNRPCQLSRKHYRVFGIIFSHFPSPPRRQTALPFFFRFLNAKHTASLSPSAQFFPAFPLRHAGKQLFRSFFASLNAKHTASLSPSAQFFPALPLRHAGKPPFLSRLTFPPQTDENFAFPYEKLFFFGKKSKKTFLIKLPSTVYTDNFSRTSEFIVSTYTFPARKDMTKFLPGNSFSLIFQDQGCFFKIKQNTELQTMLKKEIKKQLNAFCAVAGAAVKSA